MTELRDSWLIERRKFEMAFVTSMHKLELIIVKNRTSIDTWVTALDMQQETVDKLLKILGMETVDIRSNIMPTLKRRNMKIIELEELKKVIEITLHNILTIGDAYSTDNATIEELHMAKQEFELAVAKLDSHNIEGEEE